MRVEWGGDVDVRAAGASTEWQEDGNCRRYVGVVEFFPTRGESAHDAKAVCAACPVQEQCLDFAMRLRITHGVWGGLTERERRLLRRRRRKHNATLN
jgi:WhiB family redox-sensing transcriptional regulator